MKFRGIEMCENVLIKGVHRSDLFLDVICQTCSAKTNMKRRVGPTYMQTKLAICQTHIKPMKVRSNREISSCLQPLLCELIALVLKSILYHECFGVLHSILSEPIYLVVTINRAPRPNNTDLVSSVSKLAFTI
jgi:hypothetical protein